VPVLELDDGSRICEVIAIWRYLEATHPEPPLMGRGPLDQARVTWWEHRAYVDGYLAVVDAYRNSLPALKDRALPVPDKVPQIADLVARGRAGAVRFWKELDGQLAGREYVAGDGFSVADITALVTIDFAGRIELTVPAAFGNVHHWYQTVAARPSATA
jgi:glutathione S-transferase